MQQACDWVDILEAYLLVCMVGALWCCFMGCVRRNDAVGCSRRCEKRFAAGRAERSITFMGGCGRAKYFDSALAVEAPEALKGGGQIEG